MKTLEQDVRSAAMAAEAASSTRCFSWRTTLNEYLPALACAAVPLLCYLAVRPYANIGIIDDWIYFKDAWKVAQTGHIAYSGPETPMLGWQLYLGALFIRLFGFSFTAVRFATVIEAMATAFVLERICERACLNRWNAILATTAFVLSPLNLPWVYTFMSDISGVLCIVVCIYMCLRAVEARSDTSAIAWIALAALVNGVGGTARQIAWLGVLVMVPSTLWLLRKRRRVLRAGCVAWIAGLAIVAVASHWFAQQPYCVPQPIPDRIDAGLIRNFGRAVLGGAGALALFAIPLLAAFGGSLRLWKRFAVAVAALLAIAPIHWLKIDKWPANVAHSVLTASALHMLNVDAAQAIHFVPAQNGIRALLTGAAVFGVLCLIVSCFEGAPERDNPKKDAREISWREIGTIFGPFSAAYIALLAVQQAIFDRYLLPLLPIVALVLTRLYQERVQSRLPLASVFLIVLFGAFSVTATHDKFSAYRGYASAIDELRSNGTPASAILGPWEFAGWTELEQGGYINDGRIRIPKGAYLPQPQRVLPASCTYGFFGALEAVPHIHPTVAISPNPRDCGAPSAKPLVTYRTWIAPHVHTVYAVQLPASFPH